MEHIVEEYEMSENAGDDASVASSDTSTLASFALLEEITARRTRASAGAGAGAVYGDAWQLGREIITHGPFRHIDTSTRQVDGVAATGHEVTPNEYVRHISTQTVYSFKFWWRVPQLEKMRVDMMS